MGYIVHSPRPWGNRCHPQGARNALWPRGAFSVLCLGGARQRWPCGTMFDVSKGAGGGRAFRWVWDVCVLKKNAPQIFMEPKFMKVWFR